MEMLPAAGAGPGDAPDVVDLGVGGGPAAITGENVGFDAPR